jgi:hypothetical protein
MSNDFEDHELVSVYECENDEEADIIIGLLEANGIEAMLSSDLPHLSLPVAGDAHVMVNHSDAKEAKHVIEEAIKEGELDILEEE